ncbi:MAG: hypothetical protein DWQ04_09950 [Chloroflexi bacterium]|nr:MAG: hypothetical protein DWQ04_09950 [Chloroflexota bacterium]
MLMTYKAILRGNRLEWRENVPKKIAEQEPVAVYITVLDEEVVPEEKKVQGQKMAAALDALGQLASLGIADPTAWEKEQRQDRELPQRN